MNTLENLKDGHEIGGNGGGVVTNNTSYMLIIIKRLQKDIEDLFKLCQLTMVINVRKTSPSLQDNDTDYVDQWQIKKKEIKDELKLVD